MLSPSLSQYTTGQVCLVSNVQLHQRKVGANSRLQTKSDVVPLSLQELWALPSLLSAWVFLQHSQASFWLGVSVRCIRLNTATLAAYVIDLPPFTASWIVLGNSGRNAFRPSRDLEFFKSSARVSYLWTLLAAGCDNWVRSLTKICQILR